MSRVTLGRTDITAHKNGFGALPIQRISKTDAVYLLHKAYRHGITFFDTARFYTDSEEKLGEAFKGMRDKVYLCTKTMAADAEGLWRDIETSLTLLNTDYIDLLQFHNPAFCPKPGDELYEAMIQAKEQGKTRYIGLTNHRLGVAEEAVSSGLYDTLQFPFSYLSSDKDLRIVERCREQNVGFIAMKGLASGLITNSAAAWAYLDQFDHVLPIWGVQRESELDEFISYMDDPPALDDRLNAVIKADRAELLGNFCRGCAYCMPCPQGIDIMNCARMSLLIRRSPAAVQLSEAGQQKMKKVEECTNCKQCRERCPYFLNTPKLLRENLKDYKEILAGKPFDAK